MIRYCPCSLVTAVRTLSMSAGLAASTVTPGSTAPEASVTTPETLAALVPCADAGAETSSRHATVQRARHAPRYMKSSFETRSGRIEILDAEPRRTDREIQVGRPSWAACYTRGPRLPRMRR